MTDYGMEFTPDLAKFAKDDIREDKTIKEQCLRQMREWISKSSDITYCRTDAVFLLRFLRTRKFSVPQAQDMLERYIALRQLYTGWFKNLDPLEPRMAAIIDSGYCFPLLEKDEFGRRVIFTMRGNFSASEFTAADMIRANALVFESLMDDEENQIRGYTQVNDESGLTMQHLSLWSLTDIRKITKYVTNTLPVRQKSTQLLSLPTAARTIFELILSLMSEKLKNRIIIAKGVEDLHKHIDKKILPKEYGGEIPAAEMIAKFKEDLSAKRQKLLDLDKLEIDLSRKEKLVQDFEDDLIGICGSFKKLEVD